MKFLLNVTECYRVDSQAEVTQLIDEAKASHQYTLLKYNCTQKDKKQKGEIIESWYKVSLTKQFTEEKDPEIQTSISYQEDF